MKRLYHREAFAGIVLISGDGDYKMLVDFLIKENKLVKILFPDRKRASSLYKSLTSFYFDDLSNDNLKRKIEKEKGTLGN